MANVLVENLDFERKLNFPENKIFVVVIVASLKEFCTLGNSDPSPQNDFRKENLALLKLFHELFVLIDWQK
jgi:hypothetical protein